MATLLSFMLIMCGRCSGEDSKRATKEIIIELLYVALFLFTIVIY